MSFEIRLPALSASMTEGNVLAWRKQVGERVAKGDVIVEIETDKATAELEAEEDGVLAEIRVAAGTEGVAVGTVIAVLRGAATDATAPASVPARPLAVAPLAVAVPSLAAAPPAVLHGPSPAPVVSIAASARAATPLARRMAAHAGLDLSALAGTGPGGRVRKADVEAALGAAPVSPRREATVLALAPRAPLPAAAEPPYHDVPHGRIRRVVARRLTAAKQEIPHFYLRIECRVDALLAQRVRLLRVAPEVKISVNDLVIRAAALALREVPEANVSWRDDALRCYERVDVSVAVATDDGLVTPVLRGADSKGLAEIARDVRDLAERARAGRLAPHELDGGTFGLSNLGMYGIESLNPILNPPQACILGVGAALQKPVVEDGAVRVGTVMVCTLSCDHRAVDGAVAARFLAGFQRRIEEPERMLL